MFINVLDSNLIIYNNNYNFSALGLKFSLERDKCNHIRNDIRDHYQLQVIFKFNVKKHNFNKLFLNVN
jgi:hypothetical protein